MKTNTEFMSNLVFSLKFTLGVFIVVSILFTMGTLAGEYLTLTQFIAALFVFMVVGMTALLHYTK